MDTDFGMNMCVIVISCLSAALADIDISDWRENTVQGFRLRSHPASCILYRFLNESGINEREEVGVILKFLSVFLCVLRL